MKLVKIALFSTLFFSGVNCFQTLTADAAEPKNESSILYTQLEPFATLKDSDTVTVLPDGGLLHGQAKITNENGITTEYNSNQDANAMTVSVARQLMKDISSTPETTLGKINLFSSAPSKQVIELGANAEYRSNAFSGSGWRFGGYQFKSHPATGAALLWASYGDSGLVGSYSQALNTLNTGVPTGNVIAAGTSAYVFGPATYYSFTPVNGSYYYVVNR